MRIHFVNELAPGEPNEMMTSLVKEVESQCNEAICSRTHGFLRRYRPGGAALLRLGNLVYVWFRAGVEILLRRPAVIVVSSSPPMTQHWVRLVSLPVKSKVVVWLMDYHPEIEARMLERRPWCKWLAGSLRRFDRWVLARCAAVVVLDEAMERAVRSQVDTVRILVHPPWNVQGDRVFTPIMRKDGEADDGKVLRLLHLGNLGAAHDLNHFAEMLREVCIGTEVSLLAIGGSRSANRAFEQLGARTGFSVETHKRQPWEEVLERIRAFEPNLGVVLLRSDSAGLASPSKFATYLKLGIPILYMGPQGTNAHYACMEFGAGVALCDGVVKAAGSRRTANAEVAFDRISLDECRQQTEAAFAWYTGFSAATLARELLAVISR